MSMGVNGDKWGNRNGSGLEVYVGGGKGLGIGGGSGRGY